MVVYILNMILKHTCEKLPVNIDITFRHLFADAITDIYIGMYYECDSDLFEWILPFQYIFIAHSSTSLENWVLLHLHM